jgi:conjugal transfer pilus assembly protein TraU
MFPIKFAGVEISSFSEMEETPTEMTSICGPCNRPPFNEPLPGMQTSFWQPIGIIELTAIPNCYPTYGMYLDLENLSGSNSMGNRPQENDKSLITFQGHYVLYPAFNVMDLGASTCSGNPASSWSIPYLTEIDPRWQDDLTASLSSPEVFLVSNMIAQFICGVDSIAANAGFPLDLLWWCMGSWGSIYPLSGSNIAVTSSQAAVGIAVRMIASMHKMGDMYTTVGPHMSTGVCVPINTIPVMRKTMYSFVPVYPVMYKNRIPFGRSGIIWEYGIDAPVVNRGVYAIVVYRKMECCYL